MTNILVVVTTILAEKWTTNASYGKLFSNLSSNFEIYDEPKYAYIQNNHSKAKLKLSAALTRKMNLLGEESAEEGCVRQNSLCHSEPLFACTMKRIINERGDPLSC